MVNDDPIAIARRVNETFNASDWEALDALFSVDAVYESPVIRARGRKEILAYLQGLKSGLPDYSGRVLTALASGSTAVLEITGEGTHTRPLPTSRGTIPPTNRRVIIKLVDLFEVADGKVTAVREYFDVAGMMAQLTGAASPV